MNIRLCLVTCPSKEVALAIAKIVVGERLAACVSIVDGIQSVYHWREEMVIDQEALLIVKTTVEVLERLRDRIVENHPYEVPEFVAWEPGLVSHPYAAWLEQSVRREH